jgi:hypothetical protein
VAQARKRDRFAEAIADCTLDRQRTRAFIFAARVAHEELRDTDAGQRAAEKQLRIGGARRGLELFVRCACAAVPLIADRVCARFECGKPVRMIRRRRSEALLENRLAVIDRAARDHHGIEDQRSVEGVTTAGGERPAIDGEQIFGIGTDRSHRGSAVGPDDVVEPRGARSQIVRGVTRTRGLGRLLVEMRHREFADDEVEAEPALRPDAARPHQRVIDERFKCICDAAFRQIDHGLGRLDREPAAKHRRLRQGGLLTRR